MSHTFEDNKPHL